MFNKSTNKVIEFYGDFWHANPSLYDKNNIVRNGLSAKEIWNYDNKRINMLKEKFNLKIKIVWEVDSKCQSVIDEYVRWIYELIPKE